REEFSGARGPGGTGRARGCSRRTTCPSAWEVYRKWRRLLQCGGAPTVRAEHFSDSAQPEVVNCELGSKPPGVHIVEVSIVDCKVRCLRARRRWRRVNWFGPRD